ncbi:hypothetical protein [Mesorhizobium marinum]|uniref:hypothetical protein n=1 Tax=Mesorhizobium marinum TaxID=3228790 RepID=UPI0034653B35
MPINLIRLRRFVSESRAAHAAMIESGKRLQHARDDHRRATEFLARFDDGQHLHQFPSTTRPSEGKRGSAVTYSNATPETERRRHVVALAKAKEALDAAEAERAHDLDVFHHAQNLASRAVEYARSVGQLPADLGDF